MLASVLSTFFRSIFQQVTLPTSMTMSDTNAPLISEDYRHMQQELHKNPNYGVASVGYAPIVAQVMKAVGATEYLDYGAGKGRLGQTLRQHTQQQLTIHHYDPAIPEWCAPPQPCRFVACIDVLEHIEPDRLDAVLDDLKRVTRRLGFFTVHTGSARKSLADGRNAHLIQQPPDWWLPRLMSRFELFNFARLDAGFHVIVGPKQAPAEPS